LRKTKRKEVFCEEIQENVFQRRESGRLKLQTEIGETAEIIEKFFIVFC
jgi:hypothetical protein